jgi:hypothetical protein
MKEKAIKEIKEEMSEAEESEHSSSDEDEIKMDFKKEKAKK